MYWVEKISFQNSPFSWGTKKKVNNIFNNTWIALQIIQFWFRKQNNLEVVCLEGLNLNRYEVYDVLSALSSSGFHVRFLYIWRIFKRDQCLISRNTLNTAINFWSNAIGSLERIETLSVNYSYIASETGDILLQIAK